MGRLGLLVGMVGSFFARLLFTSCVGLVDRDRLPVGDLARCGYGRRCCCHVSLPFVRISSLDDTNEQTGPSYLMALQSGLGRSSRRASPVESATHSRRVVSRRTRTPRTRSTNPRRPEGLSVPGPALPTRRAGQSNRPKARARHGRASRRDRRPERLPCAGPCSSGEASLHHAACAAALFASFLTNLRPRGAETEPALGNTDQALPLCAPVAG